MDFNTLEGEFGLVGMIFMYPEVIQITRSIMELYFSEEKKLSWTKYADNESKNE